MTGNEQADPTTTTVSRKQPSGPTPAQALGAYGERVAATHLREAGLEVVDRNWHGSCGEIDLVLRDGDVLVVCEVKTRAGTTGGAPHEAVSDTKLARLIRLAEEWQVAHQCRAQEVRIDLVAVHHPRRGAAVVEHVKGLV